MPDTVETLTLLEQLREKRTTALNELSTLVEKRDQAREDFTKREDSQDAQPSDEERSAHIVAEEEFGKEFTKRESEVNTLARRIREQEVLEERRQDAANASKGTVSVTSEPLTYREDNQYEVSYCRDLAISQVPALASRMDNPGGAVERLNRHAREMNDVLEKRARGREQKAEAMVDRAEREFRSSFVSGVQRRGLEESPFERRTNPNRTDGQGGYFVPPVWWIDQYIRGLRAGRVAANLVRNLPLPAGTDSINIPKLSTLTKVDVQTADAAAVASQDFTDTSVNASVKTIAGQEDVSLQLLEQSPGQIMDDVIMTDLLADYDLRVESQVQLGTGLNGQLLGILPAANYTGTNTVTWTSSTPLGPAFNQALAAAASKTSYNRYDLTNLHFLMHPRRWFWFATALDGASGTSGRPVVNTENVGFNISAVENDPAPFEGRVGHVPFGPNAYISGVVPSIATAAGAITGGTNDLVIGAKWDDIWFFEGDVRTRVLPEILSGTLQVRFQVYAYSTQLVRYGQSISVIQGTGLAAPASPIDSSITF